ncbi:hypothetical protein HZC27_05210 [Candidatus Roizmanbacteria bacterium]|nr:hypothetical protein [Candidatus Roizmanbacteria bacterium]
MTFREVFHGSKESPIPALAVHPIFYQYGAFIDSLVAALPPSNQMETLRVMKTNFKDQTPWLQVRFSGDRGRENDITDRPPVRALFPFWLTPHFGDYEKVSFATKQLLNALTHREGKNLPMVDEVHGAGIYVEMRQDKATITEAKEKLAGEAINVEIAAEDFKKFKRVYIWGPHSWEGLKYFKKNKIGTVAMTAAPLFAEHIKEQVFTRDDLSKKENKNRIEPKNTRIVALDKGSLQQCVHLSNLLGMSPSTHIVAFDKTRKGPNMVNDSMMVYGSPDDLKGKDIIIYDDIIDTFGSMKKTCESLKNKYGVKSITIIATHGVLSYPAWQTITDVLTDHDEVLAAKLRSKRWRKYIRERDRLTNYLSISDQIAAGVENIESALSSQANGPIVDRIVMTDTIPEAKYSFKGMPNVTIIPVGPTTGEILTKFMDKSIEEMMEDRLYKKFFLDPIQKDKMWRIFLKRYARKDRVVKIKPLKK